MATRDIVVPLSASPISSMLKNYSGFFNVAHINASSLCAEVGGCHKMDEVRNLFVSSKLSVIGVSESGLKSVHSNKLFCIDNYKLLRNDRPKRRLGGVALYVVKNLDVRVILKSEYQVNCVEYIFVELKVAGTRVLVGVIYKPPKSVDLTSVQDAIGQMSSEYKNIVLMGDFNLNLLDNGIYNRVISFWDSLNLKLFHNNFRPTHFDPKSPNSTLLDYFACSPDLKILGGDVLLVPGISYHALVFASFELCINDWNNEFSYYDFKSINMQEFINDADNTDVSNLYVSVCVDEQVEILNSAIDILFKKHIPIRKFRRHNHCVNPWYTIEIAHVAELRDLAYRNWKAQRTQQSWGVFCQYRSKHGLLCRVAKKKFSENYFRFDQDKKQLWRKIDNLGVLKSKGESYFAGFSANNFSDYFSKVQSIPSSTRTDGNLIEDDCSFSFRNVFLDEFLRAIFRVTSNAVGADGIHLKFLKLLLQTSFVNHFLILVNSVLTRSCFPASWKMSLVLPVQKKNNPFDISDFRPISLLPVLSKVTEVVMHTQIMEHLTARSLLSACQSGFRVGHSTTTALLKISDDILKGLDCKMVVILVLLDFSKAFDKIDHSILCSKLKSDFAFSASATNMIYSYLTGRTMRVKINSLLSCAASLNSGVPQGSILGPLLFSCYINSIVHKLDYSTPHLFADDLQFYLPSDINAIDEAITKINSDLAAVSLWATENKLELNSSKTQAILFSKGRWGINLPLLSPILLGNDVIPMSLKVRNLGLIFSYDFTWDAHVRLICSRVYSCLRSLYLVGKFLSIAMRRNLVLCLLLPHFLYGDVIFGNCSANCFRILQVCFNTCLRFVYGLRRRDSVSHLSKNLIGGTLLNLYDCRLVTMVYRIITTRVPGYLYSDLRFSRSLRNRNLMVPSHESVFMARSFAVRSVRIWNALPISVRLAGSVDVFKVKSLENIKMNS